MALASAPGLQFGSPGRDEEREARVGSRARSAQLSVEPGRKWSCVPGDLSFAAVRVLRPLAAKLAR